MSNISDLLCRADSLVNTANEKKNDICCIDALSPLEKALGEWDDDMGSHAQKRTSSHVDSYKMDMTLLYNREIRAVDSSYIASLTNEIASWKTMCESLCKGD